MSTTDFAAVTKGSGRALSIAGDAYMAFLARMAMEDMGTNSSFPISSMALKSSVALSHCLPFSHAFKTLEYMYRLGLMFDESASSRS